MTALSTTFRIQSYVALPATELNNQFMIEGDLVISVNNQSLLLKEFESISHTNRLEIQKVRSFSELESGWDSYDAQERPSSRAFSPRPKDEGKLSVDIERLISLENAIADPAKFILYRVTVVLINFLGLECIYDPILR